MTVTGRGFTPIVTPELSPPLLSPSTRCLWRCTPRADSPNVCEESGEAVEDTADQAKQEAKMEKTLAKLNEQWSTIEFDFESHKGTEIMLMKIKDDDFEMLEEHQVRWLS